MLPHKSVKNYLFIASIKFSNSSLFIPKYSAVQPKTHGGEPGANGRGSGGEVWSVYPGGLPGGVRGVGDGDLGSFLGENADVLVAWSGGVETVWILLLRVRLGCCTEGIKLICSLDLDVVTSGCFTLELTCSWGVVRLWSCTIGVQLNCCWEVERLVLCNSTDYIQCPQNTRPNQ